MAVVNAITGMGSDEDHVAIVRRGKNRLRHALRKEDNEGGTRMPGLVKFVKEHVAATVDEKVIETAFAGLNEADAKAVEDGISAIVAEKDRLTKELADATEKMKGMVEKTPEKVAIKMEDLPDEVRVRLQKADELETALAEERKVRLTKEAIEEIAGYGVMVGTTPEKFAPVVLEARAKLTKESADALTEYVKASGAAMKESDLLKQAGHDGGAGSDTDTRVAQEAEKLQKEDATLTKEQARVEALRRNPDLYK